MATIRAAVDGERTREVRQPPPHLARRRRRGPVALAWYLAFQLRFDQGVPARYDEFLGPTSSSSSSSIKLGVFVLFGLYNHWWRYVSIRDMWRASSPSRRARSCAVVAHLPLRPGRRLARAARDHRHRLALPLGLRHRGAPPRAHAHRAARARQLVARGKEALIVGAGDAGQLIIREMQKSPQLGYTPIGLVDDDAAQAEHAPARRPRAGHDRRSCRGCSSTTAPTR